jgi:hypothetical protein
MRPRSILLWSALLLGGAGLCVLPPRSRGDDAPSPEPKGVTVLARGPVHEAFAPLTTEAAPTTPIAKKPPAPLEEMAPEEKPEGEMLWIGGYWAFDDDRKDFLWVSGVWRAAPPGRQWVAGYWREADDAWQWVAGFWAVAPKEEAPQQEVTYLPPPPAPPNVAPPGDPPSAESFYVPGTWVWNGKPDYVWKAGYWAKVQPNFVWVPAHFRWTPAGYLYVGGYWDHCIRNRGVIYAPVYVDPAVVTLSFSYTPAYAIDQGVVVDALWVRPATCHYYFGDYYGPAYSDCGYTSCVVYSRDHYDSIIVYERYEHRRDPDWFTVQINLFGDRTAGREPVPPRTLNQQTTIINQTVVNQTNINQTTINQTNIVQNNTPGGAATPTVAAKKVYDRPVIASPAKVMAAQGVKPVQVDAETRQTIKTQAVAVRDAGVQRTKAEVAVPGGAPKEPRKATLPAPSIKPAETKKTDVAPDVKKPDVPGKPTTPDLKKPEVPAKPWTPDVKRTDALPDLKKPEVPGKPTLPDVKKPEPFPDLKKPDVPSKPTLPDVKKPEPFPDLKKPEVPGKPSLPDVTKPEPPPSGPVKPPAGPPKDPPGPPPGPGLAPKAPPPAPLPPGKPPPPKDPPKKDKDKDKDRDNRQ